MFSSVYFRRKQKDIACRGWVLNPRPSKYYIDAPPTELHGQTDSKTGNYEQYTEY